MVMKWLITGGCGFLGTSVIRQLMKEGGHSFRVLDNLSVGTREDLAGVVSFVELKANEISELQEGQCQLIVGDIRDEVVTQKVSHDVDVIIHFAANTGVPNSVADPRLDMECNVIGVFNMLEAARNNKVKRFVFASSGAPAGEVEPPIHEELPPHPVSPYGASKLAGEGYCSSYYRTFGIDTVSLRFGNVYGPGSLHKSSVVAKFIRQALNGETLEIYGDGTQTRDFIYIDDLVNAVILSAITENIGGETFQIASNKETTVGEITNKMVDLLKIYGINNVKVINGETRLGDVKRNYSDTSKAKLLLGWVPVIGQDEGLRKTVDYFTV